MVITQAHIFYSGMVQGVGFRYTAQRLAKDADLVGWVKNLDDGRVEILAEGEQAQIEKLMTGLKRHFEGYVKDHQVSYQPAQGKFPDFRIIS